MPTRSSYADNVIEGVDASGTVPLGNPLSIAGFDGTNVQRVKTDTGGRLSLTQDAAASPLRVTAGGPALGQTIKAFSSSGGVSINAGATAISYAVTTGKTLYITDIDISTDSTAAILVQLKAGAAVIGEKFISTTAAWEMVGIESQPTIGSAVVLTLVFPTAAGKNGAYIVTGFEQ